MARAELTVKIADVDAVKALVARLTAERDAARAALARVREWAEGNYGGVKRPIDVWPGLAAALAVPEPHGDHLFEPGVDVDMRRCP